MKVGDTQNRSTEYLLSIHPAFCCFVLYAFFCYTQEKLVALVPFSCLYFVTVQLNTNIEFSQLLFITFTAIWL